jgi:hypothetical protein
VSSPKALNEKGREGMAKIETTAANIFIFHYNRVEILELSSNLNREAV